MVHVALDDGRIGAQLVAWRNAIDARLLDETLVDGARALVAERSERTAKGREVWDGVLIEASEAAVHEAGAQLALELAQRPLLDVLERAATKKSVGRDSSAPRRT
jgi:hypothetical protein